MEAYDRCCVLKGSFRLVCGKTNGDGIGKPVKRQEKAGMELCEGQKIYGESKVAGS